MHDLKFIHRDIKPDNFLIGNLQNRERLFCIDFGSSKRYIKNEQHIKFKSERNFVGTINFASINTHMSFS